MSALLQLVEPGMTPAPHQKARPAVGIDLGTTHSLIAIARNQEVEILCDETGDPLLPSVVAYLTAEEVYVGKRAEETLAHNPETVIRSVKRFMGDRPPSLSSSSPATPASSASMSRLSVGARQLTPIEISADILRALKKRAENALNAPVEQAVITVPAFFDEAARAATRDAARLAGLEILRLLNEPTAAALAYGLEHAAEGYYAVYDLGGGTFDLSLLRLEKGVFQVLATGGDTALGGDDCDALILGALLAQQNLKGRESLPSALIKQALMVIKQARESLSQEQSCTFSLTLSHPVSYTLSRPWYEGMIAPLIDKTFSLCANVLKDAGLTTADIDGVILVGGVTRTPLVRQKAAAFFQQPPQCSVNPDEAVVRGAALQAEALTAGSQTLLLDVTPLSLGVEMMGGIVEKIIPRNTPLPISKSQEFTTYKDGQTGMILHVVQGEREFAHDCRSLAHFELKGIPPLAAGLARVNVTFTVDADGLLTVTAREKTTGVMQHIEIKPSYGLTEAELEAMLEESYRRGQIDIEQRLLREATIEAQRLLHTLEKAIKDDGALLSSKGRATLHGRCNDLRQALNAQDRALIQKNVERLEKAALSFSEKRMNHNVRLALKERSLDEAASCFADVGASEKR